MNLINFYNFSARLDKLILLFFLSILTTHTIAQSVDYPGSIIMCTDSTGAWTGGFVGFGVNSPTQMIDMTGKIKIRQMDTLHSEQPVVIWNSEDSTLNVIGIDSLRYMIEKQMANSPSVYSTWTRDTSQGIIFPTTISDFVGIGTNSPVYQLDVLGPAYASSYRAPERQYQALVTFTFDDGFASDYNMMKPLFDSKGEVATTYIVTDWVGLSNHMTWDQIKELQDDGWEIGSHTKTHHFGTLTKAQMIEEARESREILQSHKLEIHNMAYPGTAFNDSAKTVARMFYRSARAGLNGGIGDTLNHNILRTYSLTSYEADNHADSNVFKTLVDRASARKQWLIFYIHGTDANDKRVISNCKLPSFSVHSKLEFSSFHFL